MQWIGMLPQHLANLVQFLKPHIVPQAPLGVVQNKMRPKQQQH